MTHVQINNQLDNQVISPPVHGERKGKGAMTRRAWAVIVLLAAGFFIHDAIWHAMLAVFGMNTMVGMEFSLPDLGAYHIYPDRAIQTFAFLFAAVAANLLFWLGLRLRNRS
ncbi:MAG TPA: hypothetical protein VF844_15495 [Ktedonobacteraceae bacterium]